MKFSRREEKILGAALYICEGTKARVDNRGYKQYAIEFTNNDPRVILMFLNFLRNNIPVEEGRIKAQLFIYPDHDGDKLIKFWSEVTNIPTIRFNKLINMKQRSGRFKPSLCGTIKIRYSHKEHFLKLQGIINNVFGGVG